MPSQLPSLIYLFVWLTYFFNISQIYSLSSIPTLVFPPTWTVRISSQQVLLSFLLSSQPDIVARVVFLKREGDDIAFLLKYFHWSRDAHHAGLTSWPHLQEQSSWHFPGFTIIPLQTPCHSAKPEWPISSIHILQVCCPYSFWPRSSLCLESSPHFYLFFKCFYFYF